MRLGIVLGLLVCVAGEASAAAPRVLPEGQLPNDARLKPLKDLDGYFPFVPSPNVEAWTLRAEEVRRRMLVAFGLWPLPTKTPLNAVVHGRIDRPEYTVEKVYFESYPGFFVTGNLYRPKGAKGKSPAVLLPHGHHTNGRFNEESEQTARNEISIGAERFINGGRFPLQAMCVTLARMGCVAFHYDMVGYADSTQLSYSLVHRFDVEQKDGAVMGPREAGFFSVPAELQCQSPMGLQTYNSLRAMDFVCELPDVDPSRIGVTGASGGGTQTMILAALDPRVTAAVPVVMVSTSMQGGCTCENCSLLRVGTGNIEFSALFAPKPQCLVAANDWTKELGTKGFPELQQHYQLLGAPDNISAKLNIHFPHNYNFVSREAMYQWFNQHLKLGLPSPVLEEDFQPCTIAELSVWNNEHPKPPSGNAFEQALCKTIADDSARQIAALTPKDRDGMREYRRIVRGAFEVILGGLPEKADVTADVAVDQSLDNCKLQAGLLRRKSTGAENPFVLLMPNRPDVNHYAIWIGDTGKAALFDDNGSPSPEVRKLLDAGIAVAGLDLFLQGEFLADGKSPTEMRRVKNPRKFLGYTLGYNDAPFAQRVQDILSLAMYLRGVRLGDDDQLSIIGFDGAGKYVAAALAIGGKTFDRAAVDTDGFRFANLKSLWDIEMLPGSVKYGDIPGLLSLARTKVLWIAGEGSTAPGVLLQAAMFDGPADLKRTSGIEWLLTR